MGIIRILFLADTHLGFDLPFRPRIQRRRRGPEFFANFKRALMPALQGRVDCVVHGGDLLYRSKVPPQLVAMAFEPLKQVADQGTPVYLVPGNHERSAIPHSHLAGHPGIHIFDRPRTYLWRKDGLTLALAGFPFVRHGIRDGFMHLLEQTGRLHVMVQLNLHPRHMDTAELRSWLVSNIGELPADAIVKLKIHGRISQNAMAVLRAASLRSIAPPMMNIDTAFKNYNFF